MRPDGHLFRGVFAGAAALLLALLILPPALLLARAAGLLVMGRTLHMGMVAEAALLSLSTTALSAGLILLLGTPVAYVFARYRFPFKGLLNTLLELPIIMPPVVAGLALLLVFGRRGMLGGPLAAAGISLPFSTAAVVVAQVFVAAPYYVRTLGARLRAIPADLEAAARIDGADEWQVFRHVILPLSTHSLLIGLVLAWARALGEFGATILFAGNLRGVTQTMPVLVYAVLEQDINAALISAGTLIGLALGALGLARWLTRRLEEESDPLAEV